MTAARIVFLAVFLASTCLSKQDQSSELVDELLSLQSRSQTGLIHLDDHSVSRFLTSVQNPRPYSLVIFFDAVQLHSKPELRLSSLKSEFSILARSFASNHRDDDQRVFFCDLEFKESQSSFGLFGINSVPHVRVVLPQVTSMKDSDAMDQSDFAGLADSMAAFVESHTKVPMGPIIRPPPFSRTQVIIVLAIIAIWTPFALKKILRGDTLLHNKAVWLIGSVFVYFFSVAGTMHNIIRKMPMFLVDRNDPSKLVLFYQGSGMQLGAEGFAVGFLYTLVGLLLAGITHGLIKVSNRMVQRIVMGVAMVVSFWSVSKVVQLDNWKTGYAIHMFWPSSWS